MHIYHTPIDLEGRLSARAAHDQYTTILENCQVIHNRFFAKRAKASRQGRLIFVLRKALILDGGQRRDRTADAGLFRAALYH